MFVAGWNQNPRVVTTLQKAGAVIEAQDFGGRTALMLAAASNQNPEVIVILLKAGAETKVEDSLRKTALDWAQGNEKLKGTAAYLQLQEASQ